MAERFPLLFSPVDIGGLTLANRVYHAPVTLNYVDRRTGYPEEALADYYAERARSGLGLIIQGAVDVAPASEYWPVPQTRMWDEGIIPHARRIVEAVHRYETRLFVELFHIGQASNTRLLGRPSVGPSPIPSMVAGTTPQGMDAEDIEAAIHGFACAARNSREAGYDGIELHATHGYLIEQFLSPFFNHRTDAYGGSLENRMRFVLEVIDRCRRFVGRDFVMGIRLVGDELLPGGLTLAETSEIAHRLAASGTLDFFDVDVGSHQNYHVTMSPMYAPAGFNLPFAAAIRGVVGSLPVLCAPGRLVDPREAERVLGDDQADLVGLGRALISDPDWLAKVREGRSAEIRHCVFCNQYTMGNLYKGLPVGCIQNPAAGREREWGAETLQPAQRHRRIVVVGGGPAGLEVARLARLRGHDVVLHEKGEMLGGQVLLAARLPGRDEIEGVTSWLAREVRRLGVEIRTGSEADADSLLASDADAIVIATGARFDRSGLSALVAAPIPGAAEAVVTPEDLLDADAEAHSPVVILDADGRDVGPGLAELAAKRKAKVTLVTPFPFVGPKLMEEMNLPYVHSRLLGLDVEMIPSHWAAEVRAGEVVLFNVFLPTKVRTLAARSVVMVAARSSQDALFLSLEGKGKELHRVGDCLAPGDVGTAMLQAHRLGRVL